jgi:hypothetical protein
MAHHLPSPVDPQLFAQLESDLIFPEQFFPAQEPRWSGERELLWTVFMDGVEIFRKEVLLGNEQSEAYLETVAWIDERDGDRLFSFDSLSEVFGYDPSWLRHALYLWRDRQREALARSRAAA